MAKTTVAELAEIVMTDKEREAFDLGWRHGEYNAINAAFGRKTGLCGGFDTPDEEAAYDRGYQMGWDSVD